MSQKQNKQQSNARIYHIPFTLNVSRFDIKSQLPLEKEASLRTIFSAALGIIILVPIIRRPMFMDANLFGLVLFIIGYISLLYLLLKETRVPGVFGYNMLKPIFSYITRWKKRDISTASFAPYNNGRLFTGLIEPTEDNTIRFSDGNVGALYDVIGVASNNTFDADRDNVINNFHSILRMFNEEIPHTIISSTGGQSVDRQLDMLFDEYDTETNALLLDIIAEDIRLLNDYVKNRFDTLHQFILIKTPDQTQLNTSKKLLRSIAESSDIAIQLLKPTDKIDTIDLFTKFYGGLAKSQPQYNEELIEKVSNISKNKSKKDTKKPKKTKIKISRTKK